MKHKGGFLAASVIVKPKYTYQDRGKSQGHLGRLSVHCVIGGVQMRVSNGACASGQCQVRLEVHVHGVHHSSRG